MCHIAQIASSCFAILADCDAASWRHIYNPASSMGRHPALEAGSLTSFPTIFSCVFLEAFFHHFYWFWYPQGLPNWSFWTIFNDLFVIGWISENDALARVSARFGRSQGFPESCIFGVFLDSDFRCLLRMLFFWFFVILDDFRDPSGLRLATLWGAKESNNGVLFPRGSQESPWEGVGDHFGWIWELFLCIFNFIFDVCLVA